jgi:hypothetical protein
VQGRVVTSLGRVDEGSRSIAEPLPPGCCRREGVVVGEASALSVVIEAA